MTTKIKNKLICNKELIAQVRLRNNNLKGTLSTYLYNLSELRKYLRFYLTIVINKKNHEIGDFKPVILLQFLQNYKKVVQKLNRWGFYLVTKIPPC